MRRLGGRRTCEKNGPHLPRRVRPAEEGGRLRHRRRQLIVRDDDKPEVIRNRLEPVPREDRAPDRLLRGAAASCSRIDGDAAAGRGRGADPRASSRRCAMEEDEASEPSGMYRGMIITQDARADRADGGGRRDPGPLPADARARRRGPGVTTEELDEAAEKFIRSQGAEPSFKGYRGFPGSICASPNSMVVHGIPGPYELQRGDILSIDVGVTKDGWVADAAITVPIGPVSPEARRAARRDQGRALRRRRAGAAGQPPRRRLARRSSARSRARASRSSAPWSATGSAATCTRTRRSRTSASPARARSWRQGMVLAIEPMVNAGGPLVRMGDDGWAVYSEDGSLAAHFEFTVAVTPDGPADPHPLARGRVAGRPAGYLSCAVGAPQPERRGSLHLRVCPRRALPRYLSLLSLFAVDRPAPRRRAAPAALRGQRRRRLPQRAAARRERAPTTSARSSPSAAGHCCRRTSPTSSRSTKTSLYASPTLTEDQIAELLQGRHLRRPGRRSRIDDRTAARGDDRPRQSLRRAAHLRRHPRRHDVRRRLRRRRTTASS